MLKTKEHNQRVREKFTHLSNKDIASIESFVDDEINNSKKGFIIRMRLREFSKLAKLFKIGKVDIQYLSKRFEQLRKEQFITI